MLHQSHEIAYQVRWFERNAPAIERYEDNLRVVLGIKLNLDKLYMAHQSFEQRIGAHLHVLSGWRLAILCWPFVLLQTP